MSTELYQQLGAITQGSECDASTVLAELEKMCVPCVRNNAGHVLAEPLWKSLGAFPDVLGRRGAARPRAVPLGNIALIAAAAQSLIRYCSSMDVVQRVATPHTAVRRGGRLPDDRLLGLLGNWLAVQRGFVHVETDAEWGKWGPRVCVQNLEAAVVTRNLAQPLGPNVVVEWGFKVALLDCVRLLRAAGFDAWWLYGEEAAARQGYVMRRGWSPSAGRIHDLGRGDPGSMAKT